MKNIIVLTTGSSGSSLLTGLLATQGFWIGDETKQLDFNTYENAALVELNMELLRMIGYNRRDCNDIPPPSIHKIKQIEASNDISKFERFISKCDNNIPWLWKDPRLSYTIHFWSKFPQVRKANFIFIDRDPRQSYSGLLLSRKIPMSFRDQSSMNQNYKESIEQFSRENNISVFKCLFEDLILKPDDFLNILNSKFGLGIKIEQLLEIYKGDLYKKRYRLLSFYKASIIYLLHRYIKKDYVTFPRSN